MAQGFSASRLIGYCSPKGRLLASAWIGLFPTIDSADDRFALFISKDIAASTAKRLSMFVLRSKVKVIDLSSEWTISGLFGSDQQIANFKIDNSCIALRMPDVLVDDQSIARLLMAHSQKSPLGESSSNEILEALNDPLNKIIASVKTALEQTPPELGADIAQRGMMLTGGGALLQNLDRLLAEETGLPVLVAEDPLTCVVRGCGMALEKIGDANDWFV
jgi:folate-binding Fe-S cluster repair protein YgfZ